MSETSAEARASRQWTAVMAFVAALGCLGVLLLVPRGTPAPRLAPAVINQHVESTDASAVYLSIGALSGGQSLTLSWNWTIEDGRARPSISVKAAGAVDTDIWLTL